MTMGLHFLRLSYCFTTASLLYNVLCEQAFNNSLFISFFGNELKCRRGRESLALHAV